MLNLTGQIGSQLEVTFVMAFRCVITEEYINGRAAFLHRDSADAKPGDRCRVTIVDYLQDINFCFVRVDEVIKAGDGISSLRRKTLHDIESNWTGEENFEQRVIANLRTRCSGSNRDAEMLEVMLDILEYYSFKRFGRVVDLEYGHYCIVISRLINSLYADNAAKRVELYRRAAKYCSANERGSQWAESFTAVADSLKVD